MKTEGFAKIRLFDLVDYAVVDYRKATDLIIAKAKNKESYGGSALAEIEG